MLLNGSRFELISENELIPRGATVGAEGSGPAITALRFGHFRYSGAQSNVSLVTSRLVGANEGRRSDWRAKTRQAGHPKMMEPEGRAGEVRAPRVTWRRSFKVKSEGDSCFESAFMWKITKGGDNLPCTIWVVESLQRCVSQGHSCNVVCL